MNTNTQEIEIDLVEIFYLLRRKIWIIIVTAVVLGGSIGLYSHYSIAPLYASTAQIYILSQSTSITSMADIQVGTSLTQDYKELIKSRRIVEEVISNLNLNRTYSEVGSQLTVENTANTRILLLTVEDTDPALAQAMVDEFTNVAVKRISQIMVTDEPSIIDYGNEAIYPVNASVASRNGLIGALLGIFLSVAIIVILHMMDDSIKTPEDVEKYLGLNTLGNIPIKEDEQSKKRRRHKYGYGYGEKL